jgi:nitroreductase
VRDYTDREVSKETVMVLLQAAIQAPSAVNEQPWTFVVIQDRALLKRYSDKAKQLCARNVKLDSLHADMKKVIPDPAFNIFHNAGTLIVVCAKPIGQHADWDCCFAAQNLMLTAHAMGLATCPIGFAWSLLDDPAVRRELQIPSDYVPVLPIVVGYSRKPVAPVSRRESVILCWK